MARVIKCLPPKNQRTKYAWDKWTDGQVWSLTKGTDFQCEASVFRGYLNTIASRRGLNVTSRVRKNTVVFQFSAKVA